MEILMPRPGVELYRDPQGQWRWRVYANNGVDMLGNGGEGYYNRADAIKGLLALVAEVDTAALRGQLSAHSDPSDGLE
jgi:uncharacterized protein YegP (UPF0339 family)